jgi:hypothetical protein
MLRIAPSSRRVAPQSTPGISSSMVRPLDTDGPARMHDLETPPNLETPPRLIGTQTFPTMPDQFRRKGSHFGKWAPACINVAIVGQNRDRLYITDSTTGSMLVADVGVLDH